MSGPNAEQRREALHLSVKFAEACLTTGSAVSTSKVVATADTFAKFLSGDQR